MPNADEFDNEDDDERTEPAGNEPHNVKRLRDQVKDLKKQIADVGDAPDRAAKAERELAMIRAGIDTTSGTGKLFAKAYDGEVTEEAIKAAALEYGLIEPPESTDAPAEELKRHEKAAAAVSGGKPVTPEDPATAIADAKSVEEVLALARNAGMEVVPS